MLRFLFILFQFIVLLIIVTWAIRNSKSVSFLFNDIIITTSTSILIIGLLIVIIVALLLQRFIFFLKQSSQKYKFYRERSIHQKGHNSFLQGMVAIANKDFKRAILESKNINKYLRDKSLSLLLKSETLKIEKKFNELNDVYEEMLKNPHTNLLGLRGLMEQNLRAQDYHHAFVYGEKLFNLNPRIDKLFETLKNIIGKTNNWHKLLQISEQSLKYQIIDKKTYAESKSIAFYEIAKIKHHSVGREAIELMEKALRLREHFSPYVGFYIQLLINDNQLEKARKVLKKAWSVFPHPNLKNEIKILAKTMKISYFELAKFITSNSSDNSQSKILLTETLIEEQDWINARNQIKSLLEHKPLKEVCLLMAKIEEGDNGNPQKIDAWISRSNVSKLSKIWICRISGLPQTEWTSISQAGYFNSLDWKYPNNISQLTGLEFEASKINYIDSLSI